MEAQGIVKKETPFYNKQKFRLSLVMGLLISIVYAFMAYHLGLLAAFVGLVSVLIVPALLFALIAWAFCGEEP